MTPPLDRLKPQFVGGPWDGQYVYRGTATEEEA